MGANDILIVGGGLVGQALADRLARDGYDVTVVERNPDQARALSESLDVQVVEGNGSSVPILRQAGIETAHLVVAATESDDANVVVGLLASQVFATPRVVVRVRDPGHAEGFRLSKRDGQTDHICVNPDVAAVDRIEALLEVPGAVDVMRFFDGQLIVAGFRIAPTSDFVGLHVSDMNLLFAATPTLAVAIQRGERWLVPGGAEQILVGDLVHFAIARRDLQDVLALVGAPPSRRGRIMVAGATSIGLAVARRLDAQDVRVVLLESDRVLAEQAAAELDHVLVLHGRATDRGLLVDEEVENVSNFVAVTADHESNLVAGLLARRLGAGRSIVLLDNPALVTLVGEIGIDSIISPRLLTISAALQAIRGSGVRSGAALLGDEVEIVEVEAKAGSRLVAAPLMKLGLPRGALVAAIRRGEEMLVPRGGDRVEPGDHVLVVSMADVSGKLADFFEA